MDSLGSDTICSGNLDPGATSAFPGTAAPTVQTGVCRNGRTTGGNTCGGEFTKPHLLNRPLQSASTVAIPVTTTSTVPIQLARMGKFSGNSGDCCSFSIQCQLHFELQTQMFQMEQAKIAYLIFHRQVKWARKSATCEWYSRFSSLHPNFPKFLFWSRGSLLTRLLRPGTSDLDYTIEFYM